MNQAQGPLSQVVGLAGYLSLTHALQPRNPAIEGFNQPIEVGQHLAGLDVAQ